MGWKLRRFLSKRVAFGLISPVFSVRRFPPNGCTRSWWCPTPPGAPKLPETAETVRYPHNEVTESLYCRLWCVAELWKAMEVQKLRGTHMIHVAKDAKKGGKADRESIGAMIQGAGCSDAPRKVVTGGA